MHLGIDVSICTSQTRKPPPKTSESRRSDGLKMSGPRTGVKPAINVSLNETPIELIPENGIQQQDAVENFFKKWPAFRYDQDATSLANFYRLCNYNAWHKGQPLRKQAGEGFKTALILQFNALYGIDADDTNSWQTLCHVLKVQTIPRRLNPSRQVCNL